MFSELPVTNFLLHSSSPLKFLVTLFFFYIVGFVLCTLWDLHKIKETRASTARNKVKNYNKLLRGSTMFLHPWENAAYHHHTHHGD